MANLIQKINGSKLEGKDFSFFHYLVNLVEDGGTFGFHSAAYVSFGPFRAPAER